jgi:hypothetical protein
MLELTALALLRRLVNWGLAPEIASRVIAAGSPALHGLVSGPVGESLLVAGLHPLPGASASVRRSLPRVVSASLRLGRREVLWITWILSQRHGTTEVDLAAQIEARGILVRLVLLLGGRRWLRRRLEDILGALAALAHSAAEGLDDARPDGVAPTASAQRARL